MNRTFVIIISIIADLLDFTPFHLAIPIDIVVIIIHMIYAGPKALIGILDMVPILGFLPTYTFLALSYEKK